jgi:hypothetical protein
MILHKRIETIVMNVAMNASNRAPSAWDNVTVAPLQRPIAQSIQRPSKIEYDILLDVVEVLRSSRRVVAAKKREEAQGSAEEARSVLYRAHSLVEARRKLLSSHIVVPL